MKDNNIFLINKPLKKLSFAYIGIFFHIHINTLCLSKIFTYNIFVQDNVKENKKTRNIFNNISFIKYYSSYTY